MPGVVSRFVKASLAADDPICKAFALDDLQGLRLAVAVGSEPLIKSGNDGLAKCGVTALANHWRQHLSISSAFLSLTLTDSVVSFGQAKQKLLSLFPKMQQFAKYEPVAGYVRSQDSAGHRATSSTHLIVQSTIGRNKGSVIGSGALNWIPENDLEEDNVARTADEQTQMVSARADLVGERTVVARPGECQHKSDPKWKQQQQHQKQKQPQPHQQRGMFHLVVFGPEMQQLAQVHGHGLVQHDGSAARASLTKEPSPRPHVATPRAFSVNLTALLWLLVWLLRASLGGAFRGTGLSGFLLKRPPAMSTSSDHLLSQYTSLSDDLAKGKKWFDTHASGDESPYCAAHIAQEHLQYVPRDHTAETVVGMFEERQKERSSHPATSMDKSNNPFIALPGPPGSGKSTFLAHFFYSPQVKRYVEKWGQSNTPIISLISFNSVMGCGSLTNCVALGLRIIFGALHASCGWMETWIDFSRRHAHLKDMTAVEAVQLLRYAFDHDRRIFLGVDEISKVEEIKDPNMDAKYAIALFCGILDWEGNTDVVVASLAPAYIKDNVAGSGAERDIEYVPIVPLRAQALDANFRDSGELLVTQVNASVGVYCSNFTVNPPIENILRKLHLFSSGYPSTVEKLKKAVTKRKVLGLIEHSLNVFPAPEPLALMRMLSTLSEFRLYSKLPRTEEEREYILSVQPRSIHDDSTLRMMLETGKCTIFEQISYATRQCRITTTLASFFRMVENIKNVNAEKLGPLSRAARTLFADDNTMSNVWERAHGLSIVSRIHKRKRYKSVQLPMLRVLGVDSELFCRLIVVDEDLEVKVINREGDLWPLQWTRNTLIIPPDRQPGFDLAVCLNGTKQEKIWVYVQVKVAPRTKNITTEKMLGDTLKRTLVGHVQRAQQNFVTLADISLEAQLEALKDVYFVLSRYGCELEGTMAELRDKVVPYLQNEREQDAQKLATLLLDLDKMPSKKEKELKKRVARLRERALESDLVLAFIESHWDSHVAFQGTQEMEDTMVPVVLPLAHLVHAPDEDGDDLGEAEDGQ